MTELMWVKYFRSLIKNSNNNDEIVDYFEVYCNMMQEKFEKRLKQ